MVDRTSSQTTVYLYSHSFSAGFKALDLCLGWDFFRDVFYGFLLDKLIKVLHTYNRWPRNEEIELFEYRSTCIGIGNYIFMPSKSSYIFERLNST